MDHKHRRASRDVKELEARIARQELYIQTLLRLLLEKGIIHKEEYGQWLDYVDALDGRHDGKLDAHSGSKTCAHCRRVNPVQARRCQYCDTAFPSTQFLAFDGWH